MARGDGLVYRRGTIYWIEYWVDGVQKCESTKSRDREVAEQMLKARRQAHLPNPEIAKFIALNIPPDCGSDVLRLLLVELAQSVKPDRILPADRAAVVFADLDSDTRPRKRPRGKI